MPPNLEFANEKNGLGGEQAGRAQVWPEPEVPATREPHLLPFGPSSSENNWKNLQTSTRIAVYILWFYVSGTFTKWF